VPAFLPFLSLPFPLFLPCICINASRRTPLSTDSTPLLLSSLWSFFPFPLVPLPCCSPRAAVRLFCQERPKQQDADTHKPQNPLAFLLSRALPRHIPIFVPSLPPPPPAPAPSSQPNPFKPIVIRIIKNSLSYSTSPLQASWNNLLTTNNNRLGKSNHSPTSPSPLLLPPLGRPLSILLSPTLSPPSLPRLI